MHGTLASSCLDPSYPMQKLERAEIQKLFALLLPVHELPPTLFIPPTPRHTRPAPQRIYQLLYKDIVSHVVMAGR